MIYLSEIIISDKINKEDILSGKIDYLIRIGDKNKWTSGSIFDLKSSHISDNFTQIRILSSTLIKVTEIPINILNRSGYKIQIDFIQQWERWFQKWNDNSFAWIIHFEIYNPQPQKEIDFMGMLL